MIGILDYGMGNLKSVYNAIDYIGYDVEVISSPQGVESVDHLIIPGVGSFRQAMTNLRAAHLIPALMQHIWNQKPTLGICLGMQVLADLGEEGGTSEGLGVIPGKVRQLDACNLPIPHVGWNSLNHVADHPIYEGVKKHVDFYFVHSFHYSVDDEQNILTTTDYAETFVSSVAKANVVGVQFHPEKSQDNGLMLLENFCNWDGTC